MSLPVLTAYCYSCGACSFRLCRFAVAVHARGSQVEKHFPNGTKEITFSDSTRKIVYPDGREHSTFPDGVVMVEHPDGRKTITAGSSGNGEVDTDTDIAIQQAIGTTARSMAVEREEMQAAAKGAAVVVAAAEEVGEAEYERPMRLCECDRSIGLCAWHLGIAARAGGAVNQGDSRAHAQWGPTRASPAAWLGPPRDPAAKIARGGMSSSALDRASAAKVRHTVRLKQASKPVWQQLAERVPSTEKDSTGSPTERAIDTLRQAAAARGAQIMQVRRDQAQAAARAEQQAQASGRSLPPMHPDDTGAVFMERVRADRVREADTEAWREAWHRRMGE